MAESAKDDTPKIEEGQWRRRPDGSKVCVAKVDHRKYTALCEVPPRPGANHSYTEFRLHEVHDWPVCDPPGWGRPWAKVASQAGSPVRPMPDPKLEAMVPFGVYTAIAEKMRERIERLEAVILRGGVVPAPSAESTVKTGQWRRSPLGAAVWVGKPSQDPEGASDFVMWIYLDRGFAVHRWVKESEICLWPVIDRPAWAFEVPNA